MSPDLQVFLSGAVSFGIPLLVAVHELRALRRPWPRRDDKGPGQVPKLPLPMPDDGRASRPLPECLVPKLAPARTVRERTLEPV